MDLMTLAAIKKHQGSGGQENYDVVFEFDSGDEEEEESEFVITAKHDGETVSVTEIIAAHTAGKKVRGIFSEYDDYYLRVAKVGTNLIAFVIGVANEYNDLLITTIEGNNEDGDEWNLYDATIPFPNGNTNKSDKVLFVDERGTFALEYIGQINDYIVRFSDATGAQNGDVVTDSKTIAQIYTQTAYHKNIYATYNGNRLVLSRSDPTNAVFYGIDYTGKVTILTGSDAGSGDVWVKTERTLPSQ